MRVVNSERSLTKDVFEEIRLAILNGQLAPGSLHSVKSLADQMSVSRTPVREALIDLASKGLVRFERNRGVRILQRSPHDLLEIFAMRLLLEVPSTAHAVSRFDRRKKKELHDQFDQMKSAADAGDESQMMWHDRQFHLVILETSGNQRLARQIDQQRDLILSRGVSTVGHSRSLGDVVEQHRPILDAVLAQDAVAASTAMARHVLRTGSLILQQEGGDVAELEQWAAVVAPLVLVSE